jgi:hypothetical protein
MMSTIYNFLINRIPFLDIKKSKMHNQNKQRIN